MSERAARVCDGRGMQRILEALLPGESAGDGQMVQLRAASIEDAELIFQWQCNPLTRRYFRNTGAPEYEEHMQWMRSVLSNPDRQMHVILHGGDPAGVLRVDRREGEPAREISILVAPEKHRRGIAKAALSLLIACSENPCFVAEVLLENRASVRLFRRCGFVRKTGNWFSYPAEPASTIKGVQA